MIVRCWSKLVRIRDLYVCSLCNTKLQPSRSHAHHILPKWAYPDHANDLKNGVTLCIPCHLHVVHADAIHDRSNWTKFVALFAAMTDTPAAREFYARIAERPGLLERD